MLEGNLLKSMNGISIDEEEINDYLANATISDEKIDTISNEVLKNAFKDFAQNRQSYIERMLLKDERIEKVIKGLNFKMYEFSIAMSATSAAATFNLDRLGYSHFLVITNKRFIVIYVNNNNSIVSTKIYNRNEIKNIKYDNKIQKEDRKRIEKSIFSAGGLYVMLFSLLFGALIGSCIAIGVTALLNIDSQLLQWSIRLIAFILAFKYLSIRPKLYHEVIFEMANGQKYDLIAINEYEKLIEYFENTDFL
jgi:hypothetical protein